MSGAIVIHSVFCTLHKVLITISAWSHTKFTWYTSHDSRLMWKRSCNSYAMDKHLVQALPSDYDQ